MQPNNIQTTVTVDGMHCTRCESRIEAALEQIPGVVEVHANYVKSQVLITYDPGLVDLNKIAAAIEKMGYVLNDPGNIKPSDKLTKTQWLGIGILILALYLVLNKTEGFGFLPEINQNMGYGILFVVGLITSIHCLGMCGGINLSQCTGYQIQSREQSKKAAILPSFQYNAGRVISYTLIGGLAGALGSVVTFSGTARGSVAIIAGIFMAVMGLNMLNVIPGLRRFNLRMPKQLGYFVNKNKQRGPFFVGLINGLMPCGPLQAMQLYALGTGSFAVGAASMMFFSLGTVPLMFGLGAVTSFLSGRFQQRMLQVSGVLVITLGILMLSRGLSLSGIQMAYASSGQTASTSIAEIKDDVQVVTTTMESGRYTPIIVQKGIPVKWTIKADARDLNGCNNPVTIPEYGIEKTLQPGDNVIEFTPQEEGPVVYTCWMGMIRSTINVVPDVASASEDDIAPAGSSGGSAGCGCCQVN